MTTPEKKPGFQEKLNEKLGELKKNKNVEQMMSFAKSNTQDTAAYIGLFVGILLLLFGSPVGSILIGVIVGIYFSRPILDWLVEFKNYLNTEGLGKTLVLFAAAFALLIAAPYLFLGGAVTIGIRYLISGMVKK